MISNDAMDANPAPVDRSKNQPGVLCGRCDHLNYLGEDDCEECGAPLYVDCPHCGARNVGVFTRCTKCRRRLHRRSMLQRHHSNKGGRRRRSPTGAATRQFFWILLGFIVVFAVAGMMIYSSKH